VSKQFVNTMDDDIRRRHILRGASIVALINGLFIYWPPSIEMGASVCNTFGPDIAFWLWLVGTLIVEFARSKRLVRGESNSSFPAHHVR
jgi:hypothetical protein